MLATANPKQGKQRKRKPVRSIKRGKTHFVDFLNPTKRFAWVGDPYKIPPWAYEEAARRRGSPTDAERAIEATLRAHGVSYAREQIWPNGPRPVFSDFWLPRHKLTLECDGENHRADRSRDLKRAMWLAGYWKVGTVRFWNRECLDGSAEIRLKEILGLA